MRKTLLAVAVLSTFAASGAMAADAPASPHTVSFNVGLASEYSYRGISQSDNSPALSAGADYSHSSGVYLGTWVSTITWLEDTKVYDSSAVEVDIYGGYKMELVKDLGIDVGFLRYQYPGTLATGAVSPNTTEVYGALNYKMINLKYSRSTTNLFGYADTKGSGYLEVNANIDIAEGTQLNLHFGSTKVKDLSAADYTDVKIGVTKDFGIVSGALAYVSTSGNATDGAKGGPLEDWFKGRAVLSVSKTF